MKWDELCPFLHFTCYLVDAATKVSFKIIYIYIYITTALGRSSCLRLTTTQRNLKL